MTKPMFRGRETISRDGAIGFEFAMEDIEPWQNASIEGVREAILKGMLCGSDFLGNALPREALAYLASQHEVENHAALAETACKAGRLIDFGHIPNAAISAGGTRGGPMWNRGALPMPFDSPWLMFHRWEGAGCCYLVHPLEPGVPNGAVEVTEFLAAKVQRQMVMLLIADRAVMQANLDEPEKYHAIPIPSVWRYLPGASEIVNQGRDPIYCVSGNILDPLMTGLMILNTLNVLRETVPAPAKLNKHRRASGKPEIPPYERVNAAPYVTALTARGREKSDPQGGTHGTPLPHVRRAHLRTLPTGQMKLIHETLVNVDPEVRATFKAQGSLPADLERSHYRVRAPADL